MTKIEEKPSRCNNLHNGLKVLKVFFIKQDDFFSVESSIEHERWCDPSIQQKKTCHAIMTRTDKKSAKNACFWNYYHNSLSVFFLSIQTTIDHESDENEEEAPIKFRVCMLGHTGTGKTCLVNQFLTSEYMNAYDASLGKKGNEQYKFL